MSEHYIGQQVDTRHGRGTIVDQDFVLDSSGGREYFDRWGVRNNLTGHLHGEGRKYYFPNEMIIVNEEEPTS